MRSAADNWAIVIGIDQYRVPEAVLKGAVNDALAIRKWLLDPDGGAVSERQLFLLLSPRPGQSSGNITALPATRENVITVIERLLSKSQGQGDRFFFYFSGHGLSARINATNQSGMAFADFTELLTDNSLTVQALFDLFQSTQFKEQFFFIDGCRNAPFGVDRILGSYPKPRPALSPVSPQFGMYATAPMQKAIEVDERGAFTQALLAGLSGNGSAKRWAQNEGETGEYVIRWSTLFTCVHNAVTARKLAAGDFIQTPRRFGETGAEDPILGRKSQSEFPGERLTVKLSPADALVHSSVLVRDLTGLVKSEPKPIKALPVCFDLPPRSYGIDVEADGWQRAGNVKTIDLYEPSEVDIELKPRSLVLLGGPISKRPHEFQSVIVTQLPVSEIRDLTEAEAEQRAEQLRYDGSTTEIIRQADGKFAVRTSQNITANEPTRRNDKSQTDQGSLEASSSDRLAAVEIADEAGRVLKASRGSLTLRPCPPGFFRARLVSPEGEATEQLAQVGPGESVQVGLIAPRPRSPTLRGLIEASEFGQAPDGTVTVSESVGPSASLRLSTVLALAAAAAAEIGSAHGQRLRAVGIPPFSVVTGEDSGVQIVVGCDDGVDWIGRQRVSVSPLAEEGVLELLTRVLSGNQIATAAFPRGPGSCQLRMRDGDQAEFALPLVVLPGRLTLVVMTRDSDGGVTTHVYMPAIVGPDEHDSRSRDAQFADSNFAALRRIELMQRAAAKGRVSSTLPEIELLLFDKWRDPVAGCLGVYLGLRRGSAPETLLEASANLVRFFGLLPDSHVLHGALLEKTEHAAARAAYLAALDAGLPLFRDGVSLLASAAERLELKHGRVSTIQALAAATPADPLWSATMAPV
jgi:hypothetical protein